MSSLIIGYGNPLRSDDAAGYLAAVAMEREFSFPEISVIAMQQLTPELAEPISGASRVLFLDASRTGVPGEVRYAEILRDPYFQPGAMSHDLTPSSLLELAWRYFQAEPPASLLTVTGANFEFGETLSLPVAASWPAYLERIRQWVNTSSLSGL
ncbi:MAG: hydrogenase maturation protease [Terriglobales bacterium]